MMKKVIQTALLTLSPYFIYSAEVKKEFFDLEKTKIRSEISYEKEKREGSAKTYFANGKLKQEATFVNDQKNGPYKEYDENGTLKIEANYVNGQLSGIYKEYHSNGNLKLLTRYYQQKDTSKVAPIFADANILLFEEFEYREDGTTLLRKAQMALYRTSQSQQNGSTVYGANRVKHGTEIHYKENGSTTDFEREFFHNHLNGDFHLFTQSPAQSSQLITQDGKTKNIDQNTVLEE